jgi:hypothetical protein
VGYGDGREMTERDGEKGVHILVCTESYFSLAKNSSNFDKIRGKKGRVSYKIQAKMLMRNIFLPIHI